MPPATEPSSGRFRVQPSRLLVVVLLLALAARVGFAAFKGLNAIPLPGSDQSEYDVYAWNLAQAHGYRGPSPDVADQNHLTAYRPPLPSVLMAGVYSVAGHRYDAMRLVHCLLGVASVWLTFRIGRRAYGDSVGLLAAAGYAFYPLAIVQSGELLSEPLGVFLFLVFLDFCLAFAASGGWWPALGAGLALGLAMLARANYVLMVPLFLLWSFVQFRRRPKQLAQAAVVLVVAILVMAPWIVRNYRVFGEFIPFSTMGGSILLQGNNRLVVSEPPLYGYSVWDTELDEYREALKSAGNEVERDRRAKEFAIAWLKGNPDQWGFLVWHKFIRSWTPYLQYNPSAKDRTIYLATWGPILLLFLIGFFPTATQSLRAGSPAWIFHLTVLSYVANSVIFFANIRYRAPIEPICMILAAWTVTRISARLYPPAAHDLNS